MEFAFYFGQGISSQMEIWYVVGTKYRQFYKSLRWIPEDRNYLVSHYSLSTTVDMDTWNQLG